MLPSRLMLAKGFLGLTGRRILAVSGALARLGGRLVYCVVGVVLAIGGLPLFSMPSGGFLP